MILILLFLLQDIRELWPGFHVRRGQRSLDVEHLDRNAERVLLRHPQEEEDRDLLGPRGLRLGPQPAERYHVILPKLQQKPNPIF